MDVEFLTRGLMHSLGVVRLSGLNLELRRSVVPAADSFLKEAEACQGTAHQGDRATT